MQKQVEDAVWNTSTVGSVTFIQLQGQSSTDMSGQISVTMLSVVSVTTKIVQVLEMFRSKHGSASSAEQCESEQTSRVGSSKVVPAYDTPMTPRSLGRGCSAPDVARDSQPELRVCGCQIFL
jgi:hypothetical protein